MFRSVAMRSIVSLLFVVALLPWTVQQASSSSQRGQSVEITALRTQNAKVFQRADGSGYAQVFSYSVHYKDASGTWADIRPELVPLAGAAGWANAAGETSVQFQSKTAARTRAQIGGTNTPLVNIADANRSVAFEPIGARSVPALVNGTRITYKDIYDGIDLEYINTFDAVKEDLIFRRVPTRKEFAFGLQLSGMTPKLDDNGGVSLEPCGDPCWSILPPYMEDANGVSSEAVKVRLDDLGNGNYVLTYTPDATWLADAARVYPVALDPTVRTSGGISMYTQEGAAGIASWNQQFTSVGFDPEGNTSKQRTRGFYYFDMPQLPGGSSISSAQLNLFQSYVSSAAGGYNGQIRRVTTEWASRPGSYTWNNPPGIDPNVVSGTVVNNQAGWKNWNFTGLVQQWYGGTANYGFALYAENEYARGSYFCSVTAVDRRCGPGEDATLRRPYIVIDYAGSPAVPTNTPTPTVTPTPYVPPSSARLTINPNSVELNTNATVLLEGVPVGDKVRLISSRGSADVFGAISGNADALGRFSTTVRSGSAGSATITARNETTGQTFGVSAQVSFKSTPPQSKPAAITGVRTTYPLDGRYLQGIPVNNTIEAILDWKGGSAGRAALIINGRVIQMQLSGNTARATINMGGDLGSGRNTMRIAAYNSASQLTDYRDFAPWATPMPEWIAGLSRNGLAGIPTMAASSKQGKLAYKFALKYPYRPVAFTAPGFGVPGLETKLEWENKATLEIPLDCRSEIELKYERDLSEFKLLGAKFEPKIYGGGRGYQENCVSTALEAFGGFEIDISKNIISRPVLLMITYFNPVTGAAVDQVVTVLHIRQYITQLGELYLDGKVKLGAEATVGFTRNSPYFRVQDVKLKGGLGLQAGFRTTLPVVEIDVWAGGNGVVTIKRPGLVNWGTTEPWRFDELEITGEVGVKFKVMAWGRVITDQKVTGSISWKTSRGTSSAIDVLAEETLGFIDHPSPRNYARFQAVQGTRQAFAETRAAPRAVGVAQLVTSPLATNVYTYTEPTLALNSVNDNGMLMWVHDDINKPLGQSHELKFSLWNGANWGVPANVTNDNVIDGAPQVTWDAAGNAVAVWSRMSEPMSTDTTWNEETAKKTEIGTSSYNSATGAWSSPITITGNNALDMTPRIARNANGEVIATWRQNDAGLLSGDATSPDRIVVARMNSGVWLPPAIAVDNIPGLADLAIGNGVGTSTIAFTRNLVATGAPSATLQLFTSTQTNAGWSQPVQLTDDQLGHRNPRIVYNAANQPLLIWLAGQELRLRNLTTGDVRVMTVPAEVGGIDEFRVVQDAAGNLSAVFTAQTGQRDLWVSFYDEASALWGLPTRLTNNRASESYPAAAMDSNGRLLMAYSSTAITSQERSATDPATGQTVTYTIPVEGQTDLMTLSKAFARNLTITDQQLSISNEHPSAGAVVRLSATVTNTGDLPLSSLGVQFFDGNPASGGTSIGTAILPNQLAAGYTATLAIDYIVPGDGGAREIYAIADPSGSIGEINETDNVARQAAFGPNLEVVYAEAEPWAGSTVGLRSIIRNTGTTTSPPSTLTYLRESAAGATLATEPVPAIAAGDVITLTTPFDYGSLSAGSYTLLASVNRNDFVETFKENNVYTTTLAVQPDLLVPADDVILTSSTGSASVITATIYNNGSITATNATIGVYRRGTLDQAALLFTRSLPDLPPGGSAVITGTVNGQFGCGLFVAANPDQTLAEMTYVNNLASAITAGGYCANFVYTPTSGIEGASVAFTDTSSGTITGWQWDFGDGTTSTESNPSHIYAKPGTYDVTLRVSGTDGSDEFKRIGAVVIYKDPGIVDVFLPLMQKAQ